MLTKQHRYSFRDGVPRKSTQSPYFVLRYQPGDSFQYGIVVSKKIASLAVERNRIKRMYKRALERIVTEQDISYKLVFYARKKSAEEAVEKLYEEIKQIFKKEGII